MFVGQALPRVKRDRHDWPTLNKLLNEIGVRENQIRKHFFYSALVNYFPGAQNGSHLVPTEEEITKERPRLKKQMNEFGPEVIVTVGKLSACKCLNTKVHLLADVIGKKFITDPYGLLGKQIVVVPLPHPSGASTWRHKAKNKQLLKKALSVLKEEIINHA